MYLSKIGDGHAGVVYKVKRLCDEKLFALKVPKKNTKRCLRKLQVEKKRNAKLATIGLAHARIVEEGQDYLVKEWIEGIRGDHWFRNWNVQGRRLDDPGFTRLMDLFDTTALKGIYVQNLKSLNVIYDGRLWIIIDVGYIKKKMEPLAALERFYDTFDRRWRDTALGSYGCPNLAQTRGTSAPFLRPQIEIQKLQRLKQEEEAAAAANMERNRANRKGDEKRVKKKKKKRRKSHELKQNQQKRRKERLPTAPQTTESGETGTNKE